MKSLLLLLATAIGFIVGNKISYKGYQVFKMTVKTADEIAFMENLVGFCGGCRTWSGLSLTQESSVMVAPSHLKEFTNGMNKSNIKYEKFINDVQQVIDYQVNSGSGKGFGWTRYHTLEEIYNWLDSLPEKYPGKVETIVGGHTFEGRGIKGVKISFKKNNPGIFIESGIHSYEWIATATGTYLINALLTSKDPAVRKLAQSYDWYIFPSFNPDGYVYSHETDRFWVKTRSPQNSGCYGVNLNRNWDFVWKETSNDSCNPRFSGIKAFSEVESSSTSEYIKSLKDKLFAYISFHSFQQLLMVPYGNTSEHLDNYNETIAIAAKAVKSLSKRYGTRYMIGNGPELTYPTSGESCDWVKSNLKLPLVYLYELRDKGDYGMLLPPALIIPNCEEVLDSLVTMFEEAEKYGYPK